MAVTAESHTVGIMGYENSTDMTYIAGLDVIRTTVNTPMSPGSPATAPFDCNLFRLLAEGVVFPMVCCVGLVGNVLSLLTFKRRMRENPTSLLLTTLAVFDMGVLVVWTLMKATPAVCDYNAACSSFMAYSFFFMRAYVWPVGSAAHLAGTWIIVLVTFHRFVAVCHPYKVQQWTNIRLTRWHVVIIFVMSIVYNIPRFVDDAVQTVPVEGGHRLTLVKTALGRNKAFNYFYSVGLYYIVIYLVPFSALIYMSIKLIAALNETRKKKAQMTFSKAKRDEHDLTFTLVVTITVFMLCQIVNPIRRGMALGLPSSSQACGTAYSFISYTSSLGIMLNSAGNFAIYCLCGKRFRKDLLNVISSFRPGRVAPLTTNITTVTPVQTQSTSNNSERDRTAVQGT